MIIKITLDSYVNDLYLYILRICTYCINCYRSKCYYSTSVRTVLFLFIFKIPGLLNRALLNPTKEDALRVENPLFVVRKLSRTHAGCHFRKHRSFLPIFSHPLTTKKPDFYGKAKVVLQFIFYIVPELKPPT